MGIIENLITKLDKVTAGNLDMHKHMSQDLENAEKKIRAEYGNILISCTERMDVEKEAKIQGLKLQSAKCRPNENDSGNQKIEFELEFQKQIYPMNLKEAQIVQKRAIAARSTEDGPLQCFIGSQRSLFEDEKLTDEQAELIIQGALKDEKFLVVNNIHMYVSDAIKDVGGAQRQSVLDKLNAQTRRVENERMQCESENLEELLEDLGKDKGTLRQAPGGSPNGKTSMAGSTPPRLNRQSPDRDDNNQDEHWGLSVTYGNGKGGGGGGDDDNTGNGANGSREDGKE